MNAKTSKLLRKFNTSLLGPLTDQNWRAIKDHWNTLSPAQQEEHRKAMQKHLSALDQHRRLLEQQMRSVASAPEIIPSGEPALVE